MRTFQHNALPLGQEGSLALPSDVVSDEATALINETEFERSTIQAITDETEIGEQQEHLTDLTRLASGLEGLMIEVINQTERDPDSEALNVLRVSAMAVRRELLAEDQRRIIDEIAEGRLEGSVEGLNDVLRSVRAKALFAVGNIYDAFKRGIGSSKTMNDKAILVVDDLYNRIASLNADQFTHQLNQKESNIIAFNGEADLLGATASATTAIDAWFNKPLIAIVAECEKLNVLFRKMVNADSLETFDTHKAELLVTKKLPIPDTAAKVDYLNGKSFIYDVYLDNVSFGRNCRIYYVPRPQTDGSAANQYLAEGDAYSMAFSAMGVDLRTVIKQGVINCDRAGLLNALAALRTTLRDIDKYYTKLDMLGVVYQEYIRNCKEYDSFLKREYVNNIVIRDLKVVSFMIGNLIDMACLPTASIILSVADVAGVIKSTVYSSNLGAKA